MIDSKGSLLVTYWRKVVSCSAAASGWLFGWLALRLEEKRKKEINQLESVSTDREAEVTYFDTNWFQM